MENNLENNPGYQNGVRIGGDIVKFIDNTRYKTLENALEAKKELLKDLKEQMGWEDDHSDVMETRGMVDVLEKAVAERNAKLELQPEISLEDVDEVAKRINKSVTLEQAEEILKLYPAAQENDSSATWDLVVENLIYQL